MSNIAIVYGIHSVSSMLVAKPQQIRNIFLENIQLNARLQQILDMASKLNITVQLVNKCVLDTKVAGAHQGIIAEYTPVQPKSEYELFAKLEKLLHPAQLLILDEIQDPHNLGACLRSAACFAIDAVIAPKNNSVGLTDTVRKVACGAAEIVDYYQVTNLTRNIKQIKSLGIWVVGAIVDANLQIDQINWRVASAVIVGNEQKGIRALSLKQCDYLAKIPMFGSVNSLNVSVATGIILYECQRQRACV